MTNLYEFGIEVAKIREAVNSLEVKGEANATLVVFAVKKCNDIIASINEIAQQCNNQNDSAVTNDEGDDADESGH